ncbi:RNA 3'-terminal phosphate cyclase [Melanomma pulvis-pyrius CBS 109.77]|uniref:RNA 3'-terminal phosphate cyclase n=1 Tax=Melanomma pulvis-pyrius CBS 109.77 TaxID=1314802 RepID=A0A6A6XEZ8_9PLEO|nr:RNA 3'-terminal phosphate cyclase [Melanomma pulvis-pyrius CBS 109.77]
MASPVHLEGTTLEGGGQLLRIAIGLSSLTKVPVNITNIRGKRSGGGGLKAQHLTSVQWLSQASSARLSGAGLKSKEITFMPSTRDQQSETYLKSEIQISQNTPGSINLVFQAILPYLLFRGSHFPVRVHISGGTNVSNSPSHDYVSQVLLPMLSLIGIPTIESELHSRGWSQGGARLGSISYIVTPATRPLPAFQLTNRGDIKSVRVTILAPKACEQHFRDELDVMFDKRETAIFGDREPEVEVTFEDSRHDKRFYLLLVATTTSGIKLGRDWLYDHRVRVGKLEHVMSSMTKKVFSDLIEEIEHGACADEFLRDQLVVFQALAKGKSSVHGGRRKGELVEPSLHAKTAQWVVHEIIGADFDVEGGCEGIAFGSTEEDVDRKEGGKLRQSLEKLHVSTSKDK